MNVSKWHFKALAAVLITVVVLAALIGCTGATTTTTSTTATTTGTGPGGGTIIRSDSIVTAKIQSPLRNVNGMVELDVLIISTQNVEDLVNPVADKVNSVVTVRTDEDLSSYRVGDKITGHIKLAGDVPIGTYLYMSDIKSADNP